jgi:hypothetical protein
MEAVALNAEGSAITLIEEMHPLASFTNTEYVEAIAKLELYVPADMYVLPLSNETVNGPLSPPEGNTVTGTDVVPAE